MRHPAAGSALLFVLLFSTGSEVNGATVSATELTTAQVTEMTQAGAAAVSTLTTFANTSATEANARAREARVQAAALRDVIAQLRATLDDLERRTNRGSTKQQKIQALRERVSALEKANAAIDAGVAESAARADAAMASAIAELFLAIVAAQAVTAEGTAGFIAEQRAEIEKLEERIRELEEQIAKLEGIRKKLETLLPLILAALGGKEDAAKAIVWFNRISTDRDQAARVLAAALSRINNASSLGQFLNSDSPGSNIDVREVRDLAGIFFVFRLGTLTHCISPKLQCGGKPYSLTR